MTVMDKSAALVRPVILGLEFLTPVADLLLRLWVANVFWKSGLTKIQSIDTTILLFQYEYQVPWLSPEVAAYVATAAELVLPVLLAVGLAGRFAAGALFAFNIVAVVSYPALQLPGKLEHLLWGIMLLMPLFRGPGKISVDYFFRRRYVD
jgi:putative oxidoreductase